MEGASVAFNIDLVAAAGGATLNLEHRASLPSALAILQSENNFSRVTLWGRILGDKQDYIIAQGYSPSLDDKRERSVVAGGNPLLAEFFHNLRQIPKKTFRLSPDGVTFVPVPPVDDEIIRKNKEFTKDLTSKGQVFAPFSGDPATKLPYQFVIPPPPKEPKEPKPPAAEGEEEAEPEAEAEAEPAEEEEEAQATIEEREISEEERLAFAIDAIDHDTNVVPRGAFILGSSARILQNTAFAGLEQHEARKLTNYFHLRPPEKLQGLPMQDRAALAKSLDFLDPLSLDTPKGCWASGFDGTNNSATLRSLIWPGYTFYHVVGTSNYGSFYSGTCERNLDIAFML